jgi:fatty acid desaturase
MDWFVSKSTLIQSSVGSTPVIGSSLKELTVRSTEKGIIRLIDHFLIILISGYCWGTNWENNWVVALPVLIIYGFSLAAMFAPLHECSHRTAFANRRLNDVIGWFAGLLSFYNITYFRHYHKWHHLHTLDPDRDPEMSEPPLKTKGDYLLYMSGLPWWQDKIKTNLMVAFGKLDQYPFIPDGARAAVVRSTRLQLAVYAIAILISVVAQQPWFILYWILPMCVGQPILRFILLAEHTGCHGVQNSFSNTRTTLTLWPLRFLMWNMSFHAEHHLYPAIPFYQLPVAHQQLQQYFVHVDLGYVKVNRGIIAGLDATP